MRYGFAAGAFLLLLSFLPAASTPAAAQDAPPAGGAAPAEPADPVGEAKKLNEEGQALFKQAGDTDATPEERKKCRKEAYAKLTKARDLLDTWCEKHPEDEDRLARLYSQIAKSLFWLRKEGGVGEFGGVKPKPTPPPTPGPAPGPEAGKPAPEAPPAPGPAVPPPPSPAAVLAEIEAYAKAHPGDEPGLYERYSKFLVDFPDRTAPEYARASQRVEELGQSLKEAYRKARDDDPDALGNVDEGEAGKLVDQLVPDLKSEEPAVRARAARFLGGLGSGKAAPALLAALSTEKETQAFEAVKEALAKIGGRRTCESLVRQKQGTPLATVVVDVLVLMVKRGGVNARIAGEFLADYARGAGITAQAEAAETLFQAGKEGALGLSKIVELAPVEKKVGYLEHLGTVAEPRTAGHLAKFLVVNPQGARRAQHQAARESILKIGKPGVRFLIPVLDDKEHCTWTAEMLRQITGAKPKDDRRRTWEDWFRQNRRNLEPR